MICDDPLCTGNSGGAKSSSIFPPFDSISLLPFLHFTRSSSKMSNPPLVSPLMLPAETYTDIDHAHQALLALQYPTSGCNIHKIVVKSYIYFRCDGDSSVGRCTLSVKATRDDSDLTWTLHVLVAEHNHARVTTYHPRTGSALWRVLLRDPSNHRTSRAPSPARKYATETGGSAERDEYRGNNDSNGSTPTVQSPLAECRRVSSRSTADDVERETSLTTLSNNSVILAALQTTWKTIRMNVVLPRPLRSRVT